MNNASTGLTTPFLSFIFRDKRNRIFLLVALSGTVLQFITFKLLYPYADFISDSYSYLSAAHANLDINIWPIGYSRFLHFFRFLTTSDTALVSFQYFFLESASLYFFFTILCVYNPGKLITYILFLFLFFNPLFLYLSNYINSDPLFAALSLCWITQLVWIVYRPALYLIFTQALLLYLCFTVRNNALYYPFVTALAFMLSKQRLWKKIVGMLLSLILIISFINNQCNAAFKITGKRQFSLFTGWQLANNALFMYKQIDVDSTQLPSEASRELDHITKQFFKHTPPDMENILSGYMGNFFIRQPDAPLRQYFKQHIESADINNTVADWGKASIIFEEYGSYLIQHHPGAFARYFMLTNVKTYFFPPLEKLEIYNLGNDEVPPIAQYWFQYNSGNVTSVSRTLQGKLLFIFTPLFFLINLYFVAGIVLFLIIGKKAQVEVQARRIILLISCFLAANFAFSIFTTMNVLRYQFFPMIICFTFGLVLMSWKSSNPYPEEH